MILTNIYESICVCKRFYVANHQKSGRTKAGGIDAGCPGGGYCNPSHGACWRVMENDFEGKA